jgi:hypothetical protein
LPEFTMSQSPDQPEDASKARRRPRARMSVVPPGEGSSAPGPAPLAAPDLIPAVLPDPAVARLAVQSSATIAERLAALSFDAMADSQALARRWASETAERLALLARPPERPEDVMHAVAGFLAAQGDLATAQVGRALALAQRVQVEAMGLAAEAGHALAEETATALQRAARMRPGRD